MTQGGGQHSHFIAGSDIQAAVKLASGHGFGKRHGSPQRGNEIMNQQKEHDCKKNAGPDSEHDGASGNIVDGCKHLTALGLDDNRPVRLLIRFIQCDPVLPAPGIFIYAVAPLHHLGSQRGGSHGNHDFRAVRVIHHLAHAGGDKGVTQLADANRRNEFFPQFGEIHHGHQHAARLSVQNHRHGKGDKGILVRPGQGCSHGVPAVQSGLEGGRIRHGHPHPLLVAAGKDTSVFIRGIHIKKDSVPQQGTVAQGNAHALLSGFAPVRGVQHTHGRNGGIAAQIVQNPLLVIPESHAHGTQIAFKHGHHSLTQSLFRPRIGVPAGKTECKYKHQHGRQHNFCLQRQLHGSHPVKTKKETCPCQQRHAAHSFPAGNSSRWKMLNIPLLLSTIIPGTLRRIKNIFKTLSLCVAPKMTLTAETRARRERRHPAACQCGGEHGGPAGIASDAVQRGTGGKRGQK